MVLISCEDVFLKPLAVLAIAQKADGQRFQGLTGIRPWAPVCRAVRLPANSHRRRRYPCYGHQLNTWFLLHRRDLHAGGGCQVTWAQQAVILYRWVVSGASWIPSGVMLTLHVGPCNKLQLISVFCRPPWHLSFLTRDRTFAPLQWPTREAPRIG